MVERMKNFINLLAAGGKKDLHMQVGNADVSGICLTGEELVLLYLAISVIAFYCDVSCS